jgi:hypothetical protein
VRIWLDDGCVSGGVKSCAVKTTLASNTPFAVWPDQSPRQSYSGARFPDLITEHVAAIDFVMAAAALQCDPRSPPFDVALAAAQRLVDRNWPCIMRLAAELSRRGELDYDTCRLIVTARRWMWAALTWSGACRSILQIFVTLGKWLGKPSNYE